MEQIAGSAGEFLDAQFIEVEGARLAYRRSEGEAGRAGLVWLGGFHSDMKGEKASRLHAAARGAGRSFLRFDYFGHGESEGAFADGTISRWRSDALAMIDALTHGPQVFVGSSMGGWMALLAALARPERCAGMVLLAPAPDFTDKLMWPAFSEAIRREIEKTGSWTRPSPYDEAGYPITRALIEDGRRWNILDAPIPIRAPVSILQGMQDEDVPWRHAFKLVEAIKSADVRFTLIKDGDHRLSRPQDIAFLIETALGMAEGADGE